MIKLLEILTELSPEVKKNAFDKMKAKGQNKRAEKWEDYYILRDLKKFEDKPYKDYVILSFSVNKPRKEGETVITIWYGSPRHKEFNKVSARMEYYVEEDQYSGAERDMSRQDARLLGMIAKTVNPNTKYATGTADFQIKGY